MKLWEQISHQRVQYIIESYQLYGDAKAAFGNYVNDLLLVYPSTQIELALVETLVASWSHVPVIKGMAFIKQTHARLKAWQKSSAINSVITPAQFKQIANLDPTPVFGTNYNSPIRHKSTH